MALPPEEHYPLAEVAADWKVTVDKLWRYAEKGELQICVSLDNERADLCEFVFDFDLYSLAPSDALVNTDHEKKFLTAKNIMVVFLNGPYPLHPKPMGVLAMISLGEPHPRHIIKGIHADEAEIKSKPDKYGFEPNTSGYAIYRFILHEPLHNPRHVITHEEKERFEDLHRPGGTTGQNEPVEQTHHAKEAYPSLVGPLNDKTIWGYAKMAPIIGVNSAEYLEKKIVKEKNFPLNLTEDGRPYCWLSQLQKFALTRKKYTASAKPFPRKKV